MLILAVLLAGNQSCSASPDNREQPATLAKEVDDERTTGQGTADLKKVTGDVFRKIALLQRAKAENAEGVIVPPDILPAEREEYRQYYLHGFYVGVLGMRYPCLRRVSADSARGRGWGDGQDAGWVAFEEIVQELGGPW
jgi:hypothetical protein